MTLLLVTCVGLIPEKMCPSLAEFLSEGGAFLFGEAGVVFGDAVWGLGCAAGLGNGPCVGAGGDFFGGAVDAVEVGCVGHYGVGGDVIKGQPAGVAGVGGERYLGVVGGLGGDVGGVWFPGW